MSGRARWLTLEELAARLGIPLERARTMAGNGEFLGALLDERGWAFPGEAVQKFAERFRHLSDDLPPAA